MRQKQKHMQKKKHKHMLKFKTILIIAAVVCSAILPANYSHAVGAPYFNYYSVLMEQVRSIGMMSDSHYYGVVYAKVADFDGNGTQELYIVTRPTQSSDYIERLYEGERIVYENEIAGPDSGRVRDASLSVGEGPQGVYLSHSGYYSSGGFELGMTYDYSSWNTYFHFENGQVEEALSYAMREYAYDMVFLEAYYNEEPSAKVNEAFKNWDGVSAEFIIKEYMVNDREVSKEAYDASVAYYRNVLWQPIIDGSAGANMPVVNSGAIINELLNELEGAIQPSVLGEDLKATMDPKLKASLITWLRYSQYFWDGYTIGQHLEDEELFNYLFMPDGGSHALEEEHRSELVDSEFPEFTYSRMVGQDVDRFLSVYLGQAFTEEDFTVGHEYFPYVKKDGYYYFPDFAMGWHSYVIPYIRSIHELAPDIYYIAFTDYELIEAEFANLPANNVWGIPPAQLFNVITEVERNALPVDSRGYAVMKHHVIDGEHQWTLIERNTSGSSFDDTIIAPFIKRELDPTQSEANDDLPNEQHVEAVEAVETVETVEEVETTEVVEAAEVDKEAKATEADAVVSEPNQNTNRWIWLGGGIGLVVIAAGIIVLWMRKRNNK